MSVFLQPIYTQTVGSGGAASITFNSIPQSFNDLRLDISARDNRSSDIVDDINLRFNNDSSANYSVTLVYANNTIIQSPRGTGLDKFPIGASTTTTSTSNTFSNVGLHIPNYTSSNFKTATSEVVIENNATASWMFLHSGLWRNSSAITSITLLPNIGTQFLQYSTFSLYGITKG